MKKLFPIVACTFLSISIHAQALSTYTFSQTTIPYQSLGANKTVVKSGWSLGFTNVFTLPLSLKLWGYDRANADAYVNEKGQLQLNGQFNDGLIVSGIGTALYGSAASTEGFINYVVEGSSGNRIAKVEYAHVGFFAELSHQSYMSFQIWLYESNNNIEIHYGPNNIVTGSAAMPENVGIFLSDGYNTTTSLTLSGNPAAPTLGTNMLQGGAYINAFPAPNTVYKFASNGTGNPTAIEESIKSSDLISASFNPNDKSILVQSSKDDITGVCIIATDGKSAKSFNEIKSKSKRLEVAALTNGVYVLKIYTGKNVATKKISIY